MLMTIRIPSQLKEKVDQLVNKGLYPDFSSMAVVAIENLLVAEEEHAGTAPASLQPEAQPGPATPPAVSARPPFGTLPRRIIAPSPRLPAFAWHGTPEAAARQQRDFPGDRFAKGEKVCVERWLFGQQNRVVPLKVNARLLLTVLSDMADEPLLPVVTASMSAHAVAVGEAFSRIDSENGRKKDDALATAFPSPDSEKSRQRFADQFVATENSQGELTGMLIDWKLGAVDRKKGKTYLYPTAACIVFADMHSPLLDNEHPDGIVTRFSDEELNWILQHIAAHVHVESFAFNTLLKGIVAGHKDPQSLDKYVRDIGLIEREKTTDDFVATQRAGAVSRMADIDLVRRVRDGVRVSYEITARGHQWMNALT